MQTYRLSARALSDLEEICAYLASEGSEGIATRLIEQFTNKFRLMARMPRIGRARPEVGVGVRSLTMKPYGIYYRIASPDAIVILCVMHGCRDLSSLQL